MILLKKTVYTSTLFANKTIKSDTEHVISVLVGNLLGDGYAEKRNNATRFHIHMSSKNAEYIFWFHKFFMEKKYCSAEKPKVKKQIKKNNTVYYSIKFKTFSFSSLNWLYDKFYTHEKKKTIPADISSLLTEKALAIWFMDDGGKSGSGVKISTESFTYSENMELRKAIFQKFSLQPSIHHHKNKYVLYFKKNDMVGFNEIVKPHMLDCMHYKLH